jgi:SAM-dependent methyltransferase
MLYYTDAKDFGGRLMSRLTISIFTPTHRTKYLLEAYESIRDQDYDEWVIYPNAGATVEDIPREILADNRTVLITPGVEFTPKFAADGLPNIGSVKKYVCSKCKGDLLAELDHDDMLTPHTIERVRDAFEDPDVLMVYTNAASFNNDDKSPRFFGNAGPSTNYDSINGWSYRDFYMGGVLYKETVCPESTPFHNSLIWFAPDHLRVFRAAAYNKLGGHNEDLATLDDQDLMARFFIEGKFKHLDFCGYLYRVDGSNSWLVRNEALQETKWEIQRQYLYQMIVAEGTRNGSIMLDLGGGIDRAEGFISVDLVGGDVCCDLNGSWAFEDSSVYCIRAFDIAEHLLDPIHFMSEAHRVLMPGGYLLFNTPSAMGQGAFQDPTHRSFWVENSLLYYTRREQARYIRNTEIRFKDATLFTYYPSQWHQDKNVSYISSVLICLKDSYRPMGPELI